MCSLLLMTFTPVSFCITMSSDRLIKYNHYQTTKTATPLAVDLVTRRTMTTQKSNEAKYFSRVFVPFLFCLTARWLPRWPCGSNNTTLACLRFGVSEFLFNYTHWNDRAPTNLLLLVVISNKVLLT